jgi:hypothetical protein
MIGPAVDDPGRKEHEGAAAQRNPQESWFFVAPVLTFHDANVPGRTLSEDEG